MRSNLASSPIGLPGHTALLVAILSTTASACHRTPAPPSDEVAAFALRAVEESRGPGIGRDTIDEQLVELVRRVQLVKRATLDTMDKQRLLEVFAGEAGPDKKYDKAERPRMQRERAARGIKQSLSGKCTADRIDEGRDARVHFLTEPLAGEVPAEIVAGVADLARRLTSAQLARVRCEKGELGFLIVRGDAGSLRLIDVFEIRPSPIEIHPDDPSMK